MKRYYHVYTKGLEDDVIFRRQEDYSAGMNYVPVALLSLDILLLAFVLMSNHFHFLIYGTYDDAVRFIEVYKNLIGRYARNSYEVKEMLRRVPTGVSLVTDSVEELKQKVAYVLNNPVAAGVNCFPLSYEWGSGRCYFNATKNKVITALSSYTDYQQRRLIRSHKQLPQDYKIAAGGYVDPSCYVNADLVERLFYRASSMSYYLSQSSKPHTTLLISDAILSDVVKEIMDKQYGGLPACELARESLSVLVTDLNRRFNSSPKQIARILKISLPEVVSILKR